MVADPDRLDDAQLDDLRRELTCMSDAALARTYEIYRAACGLRKDGIPAPATMRRFWQVWGVPPPVEAEPVNMILELLPHPTLDPRYAGMAR